MPQQSLAGPAVTVTVVVGAPAAMAAAAVAAVAAVTAMWALVAGAVVAVAGAVSPPGAAAEQAMRVRGRAAPLTYRVSARHLLPVPWPPTRPAIRPRRCPPWGLEVRAVG